MRVLRWCVLSVLVLALGSPATASEAESIASATGARATISLDRGPIPVEQAFKLKAAMGDAAFAAEVEAVLGQLRDRTERTDNCANSAETAAAGQLALVRRTRDPEAYANSKAAADAALARRRELRDLYLSGAPAPPPYGLVSRMAARAKAEPNPRLAELYRRMAEDQFSHTYSVTLRPFFGPGVHTTWEKGLDDAALAYVDATVSSEWCPMKVADAAWLAADLEKHGWYKISIYGPDADRAAWLIVQHARHDLDLQQRALAMLEPLWRSGETKGENYAMLYDQTARYTGRAGRFGVMGDCSGPGVWTPAPLNDPDEVDVWRAKAGMSPFREYVATRSRGCTD